MKITFGIKVGDEARGGQTPLIWDSSQTINPHAIVLGDSGVGKSYTLRNMAHDIAQDGRTRVHIIDVAGDLGVAGASSVKFSESTDFGFNPLEINPDPDFGGVRKRIQSFLAAINRSQHKLG